MHYSTIVKKLLKAKCVPLLRGKFGIGKSAIVRSVADDMNLEVIDCRLATMDPTDLSGLPFKVAIGESDYVQYLTNTMFPTEEYELPAGKDGWLVFFDEITSVLPSLQNMAYRIIHEREVAQKKLHPAVHIVAAGNRENDMGANKLTEGMLTRFSVIDIEVRKDDWLKQAAKDGISSEIIAYITWKGMPALDTLPNNGKGNNATNYALPRTWYKADGIIKANGINDPDIAVMLNGTIGPTSSDFIAYLKYFADAPSVEDILDAPNDVAIPSKNEIGKRYAISSILSEYLYQLATVDFDEAVFDEDSSDILKYVERFDMPELVTSMISKALNANMLCITDSLLKWSEKNAEYGAAIRSFEKVV